MSQHHPVQPLQESDLEALAELCREHSRYERSERLACATPASLRTLFLQPTPRAQCWIAHAEGQAVGFAVASLEVSAWDADLYYHMDCLFLNEAARGRGLGQKLMHAVGAEAVRLGAINLQWQTPQWNENAVRFYDRLGGRSTEKLRYTVEPTTLTKWPKPEAARTVGTPIQTASSTVSRFVPRRTRSLPSRSTQDQPRPTLGEHSQGWTWKRYEIGFSENQVPKATWDHADRIAAQYYDQAQPGNAAGGQGLGFCVVHAGEDSLWLQVAHWNDEILAQRVWRANCGEPEHWAPHDQPDVGCVWELEVHVHERRAYIDHILAPGDGPRVQDYLHSFVEVLP